MKVLFKKFKYIVISVVKVGNSYLIERVSRIKSTSKLFRDNLIFIDTPSFRRGRKNYYVIETNKGQLTFNSLLKNSYKDKVALLFKAKTLSELSISMNPLKLGYNWIMIIVFIALGVGIGYIIKGFVP